MVVIKWTDQSLGDVRNIAEFIAKDSVKYARIQTKIFFDRVEILKKYPKAGRIVPELNKEYLRELIQGNYRIIYKLISLKRIDILTVHHSNRLLGNNPYLSEIE
jgi:toxin ParE1/3/4